MNYRHHSLLKLICLAIALALPAVASAQTKNGSTAFTVDNFDPLPAQGSNILNMAKSDVTSGFNAGLFIQALDAPLVTGEYAKDDDGNTVFKLKNPFVSFQTKAELSLGWGFKNIADIGVVVPFVLYQKGWLPNDKGEPDWQKPLPAGLLGALNDEHVDKVYDREGKPIDKSDNAKNDTNTSWVPNDLRLVAKVRYPDRFMGIGFGGLVQVYLPLLNGINGESAAVPFNSYNSGNPDTGFVDGIRGEVRGIVDWKHENTGITVGANLGYQYRPERQFGTYVTGQSFLWNAGVDIPFSSFGVNWLGFVATAFGQVAIVSEESDGYKQAEGFFDKLKNSVNSDITFDPKNLPIEWAAALQFKVSDMVMQVGGGTPIGTLKTAGTPNWRAFLSVGYTPMMEDADGDGIPDDKDQCPDKPEDKDGFQDEDGCPDPDNDQDSIFDIDDNCPDEPGPLANQGCPWGDRDGDGIMDNVDNCPDQAGNPPDGCPSFDRDGDGIPDDKDQCPDEPEDKDGFQDADGCPDTDNDNDGIPDAQDKCPNDPEDKDGFEDEDGCPDLDNDNDGIPDKVDKCPNDPETINGYKDDDGCPDKSKEPTKVRVTETKIEILEKVFFATNKAIIRKRSFDLLNQVAAVLKNYKKITQVSVDGYTDSRGRDAYNLKLSQDRADAVRNYLIKQGISPSRLVAKGYGEEDPIDTNDTAEGRERNRRVEFTITEVNGKPVNTNSVTVKEREVIQD